ncbi:MAG: GNAT family N-acetyltransferase [Chloroflexi bacterium]|nr:GNAT family N-acetyltransferase [Chloroflexota bacterium]
MSDRPDGAREIRFLRARPKDAAALALASERAFHSDVTCGAPGPGGPPGYQSPEWQARMMGMGDYFKITCGDEIIGGFIVFRKGVREYELGRIFIDPEYQNQGIGAQAFEFLWKEYPLAKRWTLDTPKWNVRTRHFYKKVGFVEIGDAAHGGVLFERVIAGPETPYASATRHGQDV